MYQIALERKDEVADIPLESVIADEDLGADEILDLVDTLKRFRRKLNSLKSLNGCVNKLNMDRKKKIWNCELRSWLGVQENN